MWRLLVKLTDYLSKCIIVCCINNDSISFHWNKTMTKTCKCQSYKWSTKCENTNSEPFSIPVMKSEVNSIYSNFKFNKALNFKITKNKSTTKCSIEINRIFTGNMAIRWTERAFNSKFYALNVWGGILKLHYVHIVGYWK